MSPGPLRLAAPAKLNLSLAVTGRRADGFHELSGVMALLELADELLLTPGCSGLRLSGAADGVPVAPEENLAWRGLAAGLGGEPWDCCLSLEKRVPVMAGLGGGSSDAAAAWRLGRRWAGLDDAPDAAERAELATIGADVPFFASGAALAAVSGIGEVVRPLPRPDDLPREVVLVQAGSGLSTGAVFGELRPAEWSGAEGGAAPGRNDLLAAALRLEPRIGEVMASMRAAGLEPRMTGSGPTLFALVDDPGAAATAAARLAADGLRAIRTRLRAEPATIELVGATLEEDS